MSFAMQLWVVICLDIGKQQTIKKWLSEVANIDIIKYNDFEKSLLIPCRDKEEVDEWTWRRHNNYVKLEGGKKCS